jgi:predicted nucleotide-binding protein
MDIRRAGRAPSASRNLRNVFVIHGRDEQVRESFFELLRAVDLRPLEWEALVAATERAAPPLLSVVETALGQAQAVVALLTPDDVVYLHPALHVTGEAAVETRPTLQPRPNVLIELGMALMSCPERTIIVEIGDQRPVADLAGLNVIRFDGAEVSLGKLIQRLKNAGCPVDDSGADWRNLRRFADIAALRRQAR